MTADSGIVLFGDSYGLPVLLEAVHDPVACVYDPRRKDMDEWALGYLHHLKALPHPSKKFRAEFTAQLSALKPKLGVIFSYSRILWPELLQLFPLGVANLHGGRLPKYRGANVLQWAIISGESSTAMTIHYVDEGIDTGPVIDELSVPIGFDDTALTIRQKLGECAKQLLRKWIPELKNGKVKALAQSDIIQMRHNQAKVWPRRTPEAGLIDWSKSDKQIRDLVRALVEPWPNAFYIDGSGKKVFVDRVLSLEEIAELRRSRKP